VLLREAGHLTATEYIAHDLALNHHHLQDLIKSVKSIRQSVMSLAQEQRFGTITQLVAYQQINHIVTLIHQQLDNINQAVSVLSRHQLPTTILSPPNLERSIQAMIRNFSINGLQPYYQGPAITKYYEMPIVEATTANNSLLVHISN
jgi:hypothetical protein